MDIRTQDGTYTTFSWWRQLTVIDPEKDTIVLIQNAKDAPDPGATQVVAYLDDKAEVQDLFKAIQFGLRNRKRVFDVPTWIEEHEPTEATL